MSSQALKELRRHALEVLSPRLPAARTPATRSLDVAGSLSEHEFDDDLRGVSTSRAAAEETEKLRRVSSLATSRNASPHGKHRRRRHEARSESDGAVRPRDPDR